MVIYWLVYAEMKQGAVMKSKIVWLCTVLAVMAVIFGLAGCPREPKEKEEDDTEIPVTGVNIVKSSINLFVGDKEKLEYTITPADATNQEVTWDSDKTDFATVSGNGTVTAVAPGSAKITVTTDDGDFTDFVTVNVTQSVPVEGITLNKTSVTLTIFAQEKITCTVTPNNATNKAVIWESDNEDVATVDEDGTITAVGFTTGGSTRYNTGGTSTSPTTSPATGTATLTATTENGGKTAAITVNTTTAPQVNISTLPPLKDQFTGYFMMGNIASGGDVSGLTRHFNAVTAENNMKPSYMTNARNASTGVITYTWTNADNFVNAATNAQMKVIGHTLLWHSQNPQWVWDQIASKSGTIVSGMDKEKALVIMRSYITAVADRYKGKIYAWDVLNEAFPDNAGSGDWKNAIRKNAAGEGQDANPWYIAIGSDFVYEGFLAARKADPTAILYYNDYNTDMPNRARLIYDMVNEVNTQYLAGNDKPVGEAPGRLLIEGIAMQEHHNHDVTAAKIKATIDKFRPLGVKLTVSELDVIAYPTYSAYSSALNAANAGESKPNTNRNHESTVTNDLLMTQAQRFGEYMQVYLDNADIIERLSLWGVTDNTSWRSFGLPLLFDQSGGAKPAYYRFVGALEEFKASHP